MSEFKMRNHNYYDNAETSRNRWFDMHDGIQNEDYHLNLEDDEEISDSESTEPKETDKKAKTTSTKKSKKVIDKDTNTENKKTDPDNTDYQKDTQYKTVSYGEAKENSRWHDALKVSPCNESTLCVLNNIFQNVTMASDSIKTILPYAKNEKFARLLQSEANKYDEFINRAQTIADEMECDLNNNFKLGKAMAKMSMHAKLIMNNSTSAIASMMIQGTTMGVIDMGKLLRHTADILPETLNLARDVMEFEEDKIEILKHHL